jgi:hypothetical protein
MHHNQEVIWVLLARAADRLPRYSHVDNLRWEPCGRCLVMRWPEGNAHRFFGKLLEQERAAPGARPGGGSS